jgi:ribosome biogenesis GTPase / thiamine phosphate phosphatase
MCIARTPDASVGRFLCIPTTTRRHWQHDQVTQSDSRGPHPLAGIGFDEARVAETRAAGLLPELASRVVRVDRGWATIQSDRTTRKVPLRDCPPIVVGDWLVDAGDGVLVRLERRSLLVRRAVSTRLEPQMMAANVDVVLVAWALDSQVSSGRLRDMIALARDSGARPVLVLSKVDVVTTFDDLLHELDGILEGVEVVPTSVVTGQGLDRLREITAGRTIVLLGSSGAGKSTLTNLLLGKEAQETGEVGRRGEGRHTTSHRELLPLPGGGAVIDSPGIRAATMWGEGEGEGAELQHPDLDALAEQCRFSDCTHRDTTGCALERAVVEGVISANQRDEYLAFIEEKAVLDEERSAAGRKVERARNRRHRS